MSNTARQEDWEFEVEYKDGRIWISVNKDFASALRRLNHVAMIMLSKRLEKEIKSIKR